jgi:hypothetical protein
MYSVGVKLDGRRDTAGAVAAPKLFRAESSTQRAVTGDWLTHGPATGAIPTLPSGAFPARVLPAHEG